MELSTYFAVWQDGQKPREGIAGDFAGWHVSGIAIAGDFSGIQNFVFRPVPGVGGAAKRLRSRSFRVSAYTEMVAHWCLNELRDFGPKILYSAGGRFLIGTVSFADWREKLRRMQAEVDSWAWKFFEGELVFHLAAADFEDGRVPLRQLQASLEVERLRPLASVLQSSSGWERSLFLRPAASKEIRCKGCGRNAPEVKTLDGEEVCEICETDTRLGSKIASLRFALLLQRNAEADLEALNLGMQLLQHKTENAGLWLAVESPSPDTQLWPILRHLPTDGGRVLDFDEIAERSAGPKKWLGYLRLDIDHAGREFERLDGDALRTWSLSRLLHRFLTTEVGHLIRSRFSNLYAVYGGGDDLFIIGPWEEVLDFAATLRQHLTEIVDDKLTFSAGMTLAKPSEHILTKAQEAGDELSIAKDEPAYGRDVSRDQVRALGTTSDWARFSEILATAKRVKEWFETRQIPSRFLHHLLELHQQWADAARDRSAQDLAARFRYHSLLHYQIRRNLPQGPARDWALSLLKNQSHWPWASFIARYVLLSSQRAGEGE